MPGPEIQEALGLVEAGSLITDVRFRGNGNSIRGMREARVPVGSALDQPNVETVIASNGFEDERGGIDAAIALEKDGEVAQMTIDPREPIITNNPKYLGRMVQAITKQFGLREVVVNPEDDSGSIDADTLVKAGFRRQAKDRVVYTDPDRAKVVPIGRIKPPKKAKPAGGTLQAA